MLLIVDIHAIIKVNFPGSDHNFGRLLNIQDSMAWVLILVILLGLLVFPEGLDLRLTSISA